MIIIDGFDPVDKRKIDSGRESIYRFHLFKNKTKENIEDKLTNQEYDVVMLNFQIYGNCRVVRDGGIDYIDRNVIVPVELIQYINQMKIDDEKLVVMDTSMGALVSCYALDHMEKNDIPTKTPSFGFLSIGHDKEPICLSAYNIPYVGLR
ncbi:MAG: hypothetical protein ACMUEM_00635 [Flavobacteriales bacterium AspAUS03]